jgi:3-methyladenine DNA glycosylase AlkD
VTNRTKRDQPQKDQSRREPTPTRRSVTKQGITDQRQPMAQATPKSTADRIRRFLKNGGSAPHAETLQRFFQEKVKSRGWRTAELRKFAVSFGRSILRERELEFLVAVANELFSGRIIEEKIAAVFLLEKQTTKLGNYGFELFDSWLDRISNWSEHDALVHDLLGPMIAAEPARSRAALEWAKSPNRWRRRAACVALVRATRERKLFPEIVRISHQLLTDDDDMVQKGLGWLLRETAKADAGTAIPYLIKIRAKAPRLVLRTACEKLPAAQRAKILA